jgi:hypothetical protein
MTTLTVPDRATVAAACPISRLQRQHHPTKPGKFDEFVALQHAQFLRCAARSRACAAGGC